MAINVSDRIGRYLAKQIPSHHLGILRALFGAMMVFSCGRFIALGWIQIQYVEPKMHFPYLGFEWIGSLGTPGMEIVFGVMLCSALGVMFGAWYRVSIIILFLTFTYVELIDKTYYLNHYYYVSIAAFLFCLLPAHAGFSVDALRHKSKNRPILPLWMLDVFKLQIGIVYLHAGLAKINPAWLLDAMPLRLWMPANDTLPLIGWLMVIPWMPWVFSWAGMIFDTTVPFFLANRSTRLYAYIVVILFHTVTGLMFQIGVFPLVMIAMTTSFFLADKQYVTQQTSEYSFRHRFSKLLLSALAIHFFIQLIVPWRFLFYPGKLFWTEEGYRFGWRVMLVEKAGTALFTVEDRVTHHKGVVANCDFLNEHQEKQMAMQPDMIVQYAHYLHDYYEQRGMTDPIVRTDAWVTMNGEASRLIVDPNRDLGKVSIGFGRSDWILSYE